MNIDLRKTLNSIGRCLPENCAPTLEELHRMYARTLRLRSQLLGVIRDIETFEVVEQTPPLADILCAGAVDCVAVTLTFHESLPAMKELTAAVEEHWLDMMHGAIRKAAQRKPLPHFEKAFVQIEIITPGGTDNAHVWDTSNRAINLIINNLKGIFFHDDDMEHMAFSVVGSWGAKSVTVIHISEFDKSQQTGTSDFRHSGSETMNF